MKTARLAKELGIDLLDLQMMLCDMGVDDPEIKEIDDAIAQKMIAAANSARAALPAVEEEEEEPQQEPLPEPEYQIQEAPSGVSQVPPVQSPNAGMVVQLQQELRRCQDAEAEMLQHQTETKMQQRYADGQMLGVAGAIVESQGEINGYLEASSALFGSDMARRATALQRVASQLADPDFLGERQRAPQSFWNSAQTGASSNSEISQVIANLKRS